MSASVNPDIVTDGLVLCLDAANPDSYPGSGNTWYDLSNYGHHASLENNPVYSSNFKGSIKFNGSNNYCSIPSTSLLTTTKPTIVAVCTRQSGSILAKGGYGSYWNYGIRNFLGSSFQVFNNNNYTTSPQILSNVNIGDIGFCTAAWDGSNVNFFRNGNYGGSSSFAYSPVANNSLFIRIGCAWNNNSQINGEFYSGYISIILIYNRDLSTQEIQQNYNATKGRYGL